MSTFYATIKTNIPTIFTKWNTYYSTLIPSKTPINAGTVISRNNFTLKTVVIYVYT